MAKASLSIDVGANTSRLPSGPRGQRPQRANKARTPRANTPKRNGKPVITREMRVREKKILKACIREYKTYISTVLEVRVVHGKKTMWTTVPEILKKRFNLTEMKTVDQWQQTMVGAVEIDISTLKKGDRVKMLVQSIGVAMNPDSPLIRGVPDYKVREQSSMLVASRTPSVLATPEPTPRVMTPKPVQRKAMSVPPPVISPGGWSTVVSRGKRKPMLSPQIQPQRTPSPPPASPVRASPRPRAQTPGPRNSPPTRRPVRLTPPNSGMYEKPTLESLASSTSLASSPTSSRNDSTLSKGNTSPKASADEIARAKALFGAVSHTNKEEARAQALFDSIMGKKAPVVTKRSWTAPPPAAGRLTISKPIVLTTSKPMTISTQEIVSIKPSARFSRKEPSKQKLSEMRKQSSRVESSRFTNVFAKQGARDSLALMRDSLDKMFEDLDRKAKSAPPTAKSSPRNMVATIGSRFPSPSGAYSLTGQFTKRDKRTSLRTKKGSTTSATEWQ